MPPHLLRNEPSDSKWAPKAGQPDNVQSALWGGANQEVPVIVRKRIVFGTSFKATLALAAVRGDRTRAQVASQFSVHTSKVAAWKKQLLSHAAGLFKAGRRRGEEDRSAEEVELYEQTGRVKLEVEWSKKTAELGLGASSMHVTPSPLLERHPTVRTAGPATLDLVTTRRRARRRRTWR